MPINDFAFHPLSWQPDPSSLTRPRYLSLAAKLAHDINSGDLPPGTCLPPQRELADWLDLNFTTVTRAYDICRERGLIYGITGRGTFVGATSLDRAPQHIKILDLGAVQGFPKLGENILLQTTRDILKRNRTRELFSYEARRGSLRHRTAGALWISRLGTRPTAEQTVVFPGVHSALVTIMLSFFDIGDRLAVDEFTYGNLINAARLARIRLVPVAGDSEGMLPDLLAKAARQNRLKGVFLMPACANPTTVTISKERKDRLAEVAERFKLLVLEDDATLEPDGSGTFFERLPQQTFHLTGATRFLSPGLRVAFVASPTEFLDRLLDAHHHLTIKASALDTEIMSELILSSRAEKLIAKKISQARRMNDLFESIFPDERREARDTPFFRKLPLASTRLTGPEIERILLSEGVRVCHSCRFAALKNPTAAFLRLSLCSTDTRSELSKALEKVKEWINSSRR